MASVHTSDGSPPTLAGDTTHWTIAATPSSADALTTIQKAADTAESPQNVLIARLPVPASRFSRLLRRRYSAAESGVDVMSSSAAIAEPGELLKNVRTSCFSADRLASSGLTAGKYTKRGPSYSRASRPAVDHDLEQLADARRARRVGQLGPDLLDGRAAAAIENLHDLAFAAGEIDASSSFGMSSGHVT